MKRTSAAKLIQAWARDFRAGDLTVEDVQERFASLDLPGENVPPALRKRIAEAQQELDAIRFGMCEVGQRAEIGRIFLELESLIADLGLGSTIQS